MRSSCLILAAAALASLSPDLVHGVRVCRVVSTVVPPTTSVPPSTDTNATTLEPSTKTPASNSSTTTTLEPSTPQVTPEPSSTKAPSNATTTTTSPTTTTTKPVPTTPSVTPHTTEATTAPSLSSLLDNRRRLDDSTTDAPTETPETTASPSSSTSTRAPLSPTTTASSGVSKAPQTTTPATTRNATVATTTPVPTSTLPTSPSPSSSSSSSADLLVCNEQFYNQWLTLNLTCNGLPLDVSQAVDAASCLAASDASSSCHALCSFPSCNGVNWSYGNQTGFLDTIYRGVDLSKLVSASASTSAWTFGFACVAASDGNATWSIQDCTCNAAAWNQTGVNSTSWMASNTSYIMADGVFFGNSTNGTNSGKPNGTANYGNTPAPQQVSPRPKMTLSSSTATATVAVTTLAVVSSSVMGTSTAAATSTAVAGSSAILVTLDVVQFGSLINQLPLGHKADILSNLGPSFKYAVFNFFEVGPGAPQEASADGKKRLLATDVVCDGMCQYAGKLGVSKYNLFVTTLVGIVVVAAALVVLYGIAAGIATLVAPTRGLASEWFHHLVGAMVVLAIASQYAIGVTGTYEIYLSIKIQEYRYSFFLAVFSLLVLAIGTLAFGYYIIAKHEKDLVDVDQIAHTKKPVARRYGALYDEYTFENRFFFAPKMLLALLCGMTTGAAFLSNGAQVVLTLVFHILFLVHLERCQPFQTPFMQHTMSLITVMKVLTLVLSIFLLSSVAGLPSSFHNGVSYVIVAIQLLVLVGLMVRQVVLIYQRYRAMKEFEQNNTDSALKPLSAEQVEYMKLGRL
ncbi:hypothetical protein Ae201684P_001619 [Aphanomyces euteiches]|uniref:TRP C-terminal domain-containing protein n=1 Tax=Aphanomyces euteiches TaxID=100861 RepID=A0A6G0X9B8_9STRA|nr:hypothetical protein Ae201684_007135 [Aphanomyces euteiches]KAH9052438.1 hypothetical protein Ae201684P_001619 [Aphanomyces euteiches]